MERSFAVSYTHTRLKNSVANAKDYSFKCILHRHAASELWLSRSVKEESTLFIIDVTTLILSPWHAESFNYGYECQYRHTLLSCIFHGTASCVLPTAFASLQRNMSGATEEDFVVIIIQSFSDALTFTSLEVKQVDTDNTK